MFNKLKKAFFSDIINIPGKRTKRKILIFESDDWGATVIPNNKIYQKLLNAGVPVDRDPYCKFDNLANKEDLDVLFNLLVSFKDNNNNHPIITANTIVANPDFKKIRESGYEDYFYETIDDTFKNNPLTENILDLWKKGIKEKLFLPQFHGREHLNVPLWLRQLRAGNKYLIEAFDQEVYSISLHKKIENRRDCRAALDFQFPEDKVFQNEMLTEGLAIFQQLFNYKSFSFIAPCYTWMSENEKELSKEGVKIIQGGFVQKVPQGNSKPYKKKYNYIGKKNEFNQHYMIRNAFFEPALYNHSDQEILNQCLKDISSAFGYGKPAIVGVHRLNFIGSREIKNRDRTLLLMQSLLKKVLAKWPEVEFMSTNELEEAII